MVKEANGLIRVLLIARILSVGNLPLDWRSYFPSKITCFVFSFNRKMLSGYCLETLKVFDVGWQEISACFTHLMKSKQFQCS